MLLNNVSLLFMVFFIYFTNNQLYSCDRQQRDIMKNKNISIKQTGWKMRNTECSVVRANMSFMSNQNKGGVLVTLIV